MNKLNKSLTAQIVGFTFDDLPYALPLSAVVRVIHAVEIRHLPKAPEIISGIINVRGQIIPVVDFRKRLGLNVREPNPDDRLIIADTGKRRVALLVDTVTDIKDLSSGQFTDSGEAVPFAYFIRGIAKIDNELTLIYDLEKFLSLDEDAALDEALKANTK